MPKNKDLDQEEFKEYLKLGDLKKETYYDRDRLFDHFNIFLEKEGVKDLGELFKDQKGRDKFSDLFAAFFFTLRVRDEERPKLGYAENIKSHIKNKILATFKVDIFNSENFQGIEENWKKYTKLLTNEGKSVTKHKEEIPPYTVDSLWMLFASVQAALENRDKDNYVADYLSKIDVELHDQLNKVMMYGACYLVIFFEARRGREGLAELKQEDFQLVEDDTFDFKYYKKFRSEADKNHKTEGTNIACSGVIPFVDITLNDGVTKFNPGKFFGFYLHLLPPVATKEGAKGGYLFMKPKKNSRSFSIHNSEATLYEANMKVGKETLSQTLPALCEMVKSKKCTNHQIRASAIIYMRRAGFSCDTIRKITGHKNVEALVQYYDLNLEAPDLSNIMGALAQGPAVATGSEFMKSKLVTKKSVAASLAAGPGTVSPGTSDSSAPGTSSSTKTPAKRALTAETPLRILKLSPAQFDKLKKAKLERVAETAKAEEKEVKTVVAKKAKTEEAKAEEAKAEEAKAEEAKTEEAKTEVEKTKVEKTEVAQQPFPFNQMMPMPFFMPNMQANSSGAQETSTAVMWQACSMTTQKK